MLVTRFQLIWTAVNSHISHWRLVPGNSAQLPDVRPELLSTFSRMSRGTRFPQAAGVLMLQRAGEREPEIVLAIRQPVRGRFPPAFRRIETVGDDERLV